MKRAYFLAPIAAAFSTFAVCMHMKSNGLLTLFIFAAIFLFYKKGFPKATKRIKVVSAIVGGIFTGIYAFADFDFLYNNFPYFLLTITALTVGFFFLFFFALCNVYAILQTVWCSSPRDKISNKGKCIVFFGTFLLIFIYFCVWLMLQFPGNMTVDSFEQLKQAVGIKPLSNHHPIVSTMLIRFWYNIGLKIFSGNENNAIALYCAFQMFVMALCFAFFFETLYISKASKKYIIAAIISFFVVAYHGVFSVTVWKDVLSGGLTLLLCCIIWRLLLFNSEHHGHTPVFETVLFVIVGILFCLFRSNAFYAFAVCVPFFVIYFIKKMPVIPILSVVIFAAVIVIKGPVYSNLGITPSDTIEALSVPAQHISRAIIDRAVLTDEEYSLLSEVVDISEIPNRYHPVCADNIKALVRETDNLEYIKDKKLAFFKLWLNLGAKYPMSYLRAQIGLTMGYWNPDSTSTAFYEGIGAYDETLKLFDIHKAPKIQENIINLFRNLRGSFFALPIIGLLFNIGANTWLLLALFGLCVIKKNYKAMMVFIPVLGVMGTVIISAPLDAEFRYCYGMFTTLPLLVFIPFINLDTETGELDG